MGQEDLLQELLAKNKELLILAKNNDWLLFEDLYGQLKKSEEKIDFEKLCSEPNAEDTACFQEIYAINRELIQVATHYRDDISSALNKLSQARKASDLYKQASTSRPDNR